MWLCLSLSERGYRNSIRFLVTLYRPFRNITNSTSVSNQHALLNRLFYIFAVCLRGLTLFSPAFRSLCYWLSSSRLIAVCVCVCVVSVSDVDVRMIVSCIQGHVCRRYVIQWCTHNHPNRLLLVVLRLSNHLLPKGSNFRFTHSVRNVLCTVCTAFQVNQSILLWGNPTIEGGLLPSVILQLFSSWHIPSYFYLVMGRPTIVWYLLLRQWNWKSVFWSKNFLFRTRESKIWPPPRSSDLQTVPSVRLVVCRAFSVVVVQ